MVYLGILPRAAFQLFVAQFCRNLLGKKSKQDPSTGRIFDADRITGFQLALLAPAADVLGSTSRSFVAPRA